MTQTRSYKQFYSTFQIRIILVVPPNMEHPIHSTVFRWNKHPIRDIVSSPFYLFFPPPSPHYHLSFLPWYCLYVFLFSTYVFYFSPWNTHTHTHTHIVELLFPRADGIISMQIHKGTPRISSPEMNPFLEGKREEVESQTTFRGSVVRSLY